MALKVPVVGGAGTQLQGLPGIRQTGGHNVADFTNPTNAAMLELAGNALNAAQKTAMELMNKERAENIQSQTKSATNTLETFDQDEAFGNQENGQIGWLNQTGASAFKQQDGKLLFNSVLDRRREKIEALKQSMGNEEARQLFTEHANNTGVKLEGMLKRHEAQQNTNFKIGTLSNGIDVTKRKLALYNNDDETLSSGIDSIMQDAKDLGRLQHGSEELGLIEGRKQVSETLKQATLAALQQNDHATAMRIQERFGDNLDPDDRTGIQNKIADNWAAGLLQSNPEEVVNLLGKNNLKNAILKQESGGRNFNSSGEPLGSSDGKSMFAMQVTHDTAANPGFGITPARERSAAEYNRVGSELLDKLRDRYQDDPAKVAAAYNAGAGTVDDAIAKGGADWIQHIPASTRDVYVPNVLNTLKTGTPADIMSQQDRRKWFNAAQSQIEHGRNVYAAELKRAIDDQYSQTTHTGQAGEMVPASDFQRAFGDKWSSVYQDYSDNMDFAKTFFSIKTMPVAQAMQTLEDSRPQPGALNFEREQKQFELMSKAIEAADKERKTDPVSWALQNGYNVKPINWANARDAQREIIQRDNIARQMSEHYGTAYTVLTKAEAGELSQRLSDGTEADKITTLKTLADSINEPQAYATTLQQIRPDSPATVVAGSLIGMDRMQKTRGYFSDSITGIRGEDLARTIIKGEALLNPGKAQRQEDGKSAGVTLPTKLNESIYSLLGDALAGDLETERGTVSAVRAYYAAKMDKAKSEGNQVQENLLNEAVQSITGGIAEHADKKVIMPFGMDETDFLDQAEAKLKQQLGDRAAFIAFGKMPLIPVGANKYALQNGTSMLSMGGRPVILEFNP